MKLRTGLWHGRTLLLAAAGVFWMLGCGGDGGSDAVVDPAPGHVHSWGGWVVATPATCDAPGLEARTCTQDASHRETREIAVLTGVGCNGGNGGDVEFVTIGGRKWMKKNLNVQTSDSWCYGEGGPVYDAGHDGETITSSEVQANCAKYGRLYTWSAARSACQLLGSGWRLPTQAEWDALSDAANVGGTKEVNWIDGSDTAYYWTRAGRNLKSTSGWNDYDGASGNGTDAYGFTALPGGDRSSDGSFLSAGYIGFWWTATEFGGGDAYYWWRMDYYDDGVIEHYLYDVSYGYSVRCVGD